MRKKSRFSVLISLLLTLTLTMSCMSVFSYAEDIPQDDDNAAVLSEDLDLTTMDYLVGDTPETTSGNTTDTDSKVAPLDISYSLYGKDSSMSADFSWTGSADSYIVRTWVADTASSTVPSSGYVEVKATKKKATISGISNYNTNWYAVAAVYNATADGEAADVVWSTPRKMDNYTFPTIQATDIKVKKLYSDDNAVTVAWNTNATSGYYQLAYGKSKSASSMKAFGDPVAATAYVATANIPQSGTLYVSVNICSYQNSKVYTPTGTVSNGTVKLSNFVNAVKGISWYAYTRSTTKVYSTSTGSKSLGKLAKGKKVTVVGKYPSKIEKWYNPKRVEIKYGNTTGWIEYKQCSGGVKAKTSKVDYSRTVKETYINSLGLTSKTNYLLWASPYTQRVYLFKKSGKQWKLAKINGKNSARITTGKFQNPTGAGNYEIHKKAGVVYQQTLDLIGYYYKYASYFNGGNSFHSGCYFTDTGGAKNSVKSNFQPNTMGCIRMYTSDALWIYNNIPLHTAVKTTKKA